MGDKEVVDSVDGFLCPTENKVTYSAWGESGLQKTCVNPKTGKKDGDFIVSEYGKLFLKGAYDDGKEYGLWVWYNEDGTINKNEKYALQKDGDVRL